MIDQAILHQAASEGLHDGVFSEKPQSSGPHHTTAPDGAQYALSSNKEVAIYSQCSYIHI